MRKSRQPPASRDVPTDVPNDLIASKSTTRVKVIQHEPGDSGPRHGRYPEINVSATARLHNMSKSQLSRLLNGENCPSMKSLWLLSGILNKPVEVVAELYRTKTKKTKLKSKKEKGKGKGV